MCMKFYAKINCIEHVPFELFSIFAFLCLFSKKKIEKLHPFVHSFNGSVGCCVLYGGTIAGKLGDRGEKMENG